MFQFSKISNSRNLTEHYLICTHCTYARLYDNVKTTQTTTISTKTKIEQNRQHLENKTIPRKLLFTFPAAFLYITLSVTFVSHNANKRDAIFMTLKNHQRTLGNGELYSAKVQSISLVLKCSSRFYIILIVHDIKFKYLMLISKV